MPASLNPARLALGLFLGAHALAACTGSGPDERTGEVGPHDAADEADAGAFDDSGRRDTDGDVGVGDRDPGGEPDAAGPDAGDGDAPTGPPECATEGCPTGHECFTTGCLPVIPHGESCETDEMGVQCAALSYCMDIDGTGRRCIVAGTEGGLCRGGTADYECRREPECNPGLGCDPTHWNPGSCQSGLGPGELCGGIGDLCAVGTLCTPVDGVARCVPEGAEGGQCRLTSTSEEASPECDNGLTCSRTDDCVRGYDRCGPVAPEGGPCRDRMAGCEAGLICVGPDTGGVCRHVGGLSAPCRSAAPFCDDDLVCTPGSGVAICLAPVASGAACDATGQTTLCPDGETCTGDHPADEGRCAPPGGTPGAACRPEEPRCDVELECSPFSRYRQSCRAAAGAGETCDLGGVQYVCDTGTRCLPHAESATGLTEATCVPVTPETEPNGRESSVSAGAAQATYAGSLPPGDLEDCFDVDVAPSGSIFIELTSSSSLRGFLVQLYDPDRSEIGRWTLSPTSHGSPLGGSARLEARSVPVLDRVGGGSFRACVSSTQGGEEVEYGFSVAVVIPPE